MAIPYFVLKRVAFLDDETFGVLLAGKTPFCLTLELPWKDNLKNKSCIPKGDYSCRAIMSNRFGKTFEVLNVPGRSNILFHKGNISDDSRGCIILGEQFEPLKGENAVLSSGEAFREFMIRTENVDEFNLFIWGEH
ncbi:hypothetical protein CMI37_30890 [Candidatus Pacearchaeota archaeon]|nr:hypothetical protein [Candidatus Pacearchaeota archaeon]|tara:strand:+ start:217 stop:624 length:408 start_codon:yes stop_codon:yes gene_type:complete